MNVTFRIRPPRTAHHPAPDSANGLKSPHPQSRGRLTDFIRLKQADSKHHERIRMLQTRAENVEVEIYLRGRELQEAKVQLGLTNE